MISLEFGIKPLISERKSISSSTVSTKSYPLQHEGREKIN